MEIILPSLMSTIAVIAVGWLTYLNGTRKHDVEQLKEQQLKCDVELTALKKRYNEDRERDRDRVEKLLVELALRDKNHAGTL